LSTSKEALLSIRAHGAPEKLSGEPMSGEIELAKAHINLFNAIAIEKFARQEATINGKRAIIRADVRQ
jgi:hypothetical protein